MIWVRTFRGYETSVNLAYTSLPPRHLKAFLSWPEQLNYREEAGHLWFASSH